MTLNPLRFACSKEKMEEGRRKERNDFSFTVHGLILISQHHKVKE